MLQDTASFQTDFVRRLNTAFLKKEWYPNQEVW